MPILLTCIIAPRMPVLTPTFKPYYRTTVPNTFVYDETSLTETGLKSSLQTLTHQIKTQSPRGAWVSLSRAQEQCSYITTYPNFSGAMQHFTVFNVPTYYLQYHSKTILRIVCGINATPNGATLALSVVLLMHTYQLLAGLTNLHHVHKSACTLVSPTTHEATAFSTSTLISHSPVVTAVVSTTTHHRYDQSRTLH